MSKYERALQHANLIMQPDPCKFCPALTSVAHAVESVAKAVLGAQTDPLIDPVGQIDQERVQKLEVDHSRSGKAIEVFLDEKHKRLEDLKHGAGVGATQSEAVAVQKLGNAIASAAQNCAEIRVDNAV